MKTYVKLTYFNTLSIRLQKKYCVELRLKKMCIVDSITKHCNSEKEKVI